MAATSGGSKRVVCHFAERLDHGGSERLIHRLATGMRDGRYATIVCCLQRGAVADELERDGIRVHSLELRRRSVLEGPLYLLFLITLVWRFMRIVKRERVSLIHAHLPDCIIWAVVAGAFMRTPVIGSYHGLGILPQGRRRGDPRNAVRRALYRYVAGRADRTIAVSAPIRDLLRDQLHLDVRRLVLLLNGVDTASCARAMASPRTRTELRLDRRTIVACVGRLVPAKGQQFLVDAMPQVIARHPTAALLLIGDGPERATLQARVHELQLSDYVRFAAERSDVPELLAMSSLFVLPSFSEGIPLALVEAMAAGKPVVATAVPGNLDVVVDERFGVLVPPKDAAALARAVCGLLDDPAAANQVAKRGQERVRVHFDIGRSIEATIAVYDAVLAERNGRRRGATNS